MEAVMRAFIVFTILILFGAVAYAAETTTYSYDSQGRLITISHTGSTNNNIVTSYTYDKADNRSNKTTSGSPH
jgi:RHS Repeat